MQATNPQRRRWYFKYGGCTHAELVRFLQERTGTTVGISMKTGRARLLSRLRALDRKATFRFLDLPPELRLRVYEHLLVARPFVFRSRLQTAVLRTSKAIYSEVEPVLYKGSRFNPILRYDSRESQPHYTLHLPRPGCSWPYIDDIDKKRWAWVLEPGMMAYMSPMLSGIRRLTIRLVLGQTPDNPQAHHASALITRLCMLMCGNTKMKELIFSLHPRDKNSSVAISKIPQIFWPIILLRSDIIVRFEGVSEVAGSQQLEHGERESQRALLPPGTAEAVCKLVAKLRRRCEAARIKACSGSAPTLPFSHTQWSGRSDWGDVEKIDRYGNPYTEERALAVAQDNRLVRDLAPLAVIVDTVDIASGSTRWKMLQGLVEDAEIESSGE